MAVEYLKRLDYVGWGRSGQEKASVVFPRSYNVFESVIPAEAGIQDFEGISGFRVKPGMTNCKPLAETQH